jgi:hypothetical protein
VLKSLPVGCRNARDCTFLGEDKAAAMIFEGAAQLYDRLATDIVNEGKERGNLDAFFNLK